MRNYKIGLGNRECSNCGNTLPARVSKCSYCQHVFYLVSSHTAKHGKYPDYHNVMSPKQELEHVLEREGYQFNSETKAKFVREMKKGNLTISGRKFTMNLDAIVNILKD